MTHGNRWRATAATWGSAAWLVLQQFGVQGPTRQLQEPRIVRVQEVARAGGATERLPDGRILTVPMSRERGANGQDGESVSTRFSPN